MAEQQERLRPRMASQAWQAMNKHAMQPSPSFGTAHSADSVADLQYLSRSDARTFALFDMRLPFGFIHTASCVSISYIYVRNGPVP